MCDEQPAYYVCKDCSQDDDFNFKDFEVVCFCEECNKRVHQKKSRKAHNVKVEIPEAELELLSVICIETSHYVCFTRAEKRWLFFDSMANRTGMLHSIMKDCNNNLHGFCDGKDEIICTNKYTLNQFKK